MSGFEIERKFLVKKGDTFKRVAFSCAHIVQGYIPADSVTVRIRLRQWEPVNGQTSNDLHQPASEAFLTIKGKSADGGLSRYEFEKAITQDEARELLRLCRGGVIDKHRYLVRSGQHVFEVDEFHGDNQGLVMAEVELSAADEGFEIPGFIGPEVTGDRRFYNKHMLKAPFVLWKDTIEEGYRH